MPSTYPFQTSQLYLLLFLPDLLENFNYKMSSIPEENAFEVLFFVEFPAVYIKTDSVNPGGGNVMCVCLYQKIECV